MAVEVKIKGKGLFKKTLTFQDILENNMRYGVMDEAYRLDEGKVGDWTVIFNGNHVCRGYEISLKKGEINLRMPLPTSEEDIIYFYEYIKNLCAKMNTKEFFRDEEKVNFAKIPACINLDIEASTKALEKIEEGLDNKDYSSFYIFGALNPIALGKRELEKFAGNIQNFGKVLDELQKQDIYYAKNRIYQREDKTNFGVYVLTENVPTVLPFEAKPFILDNDIKINDWYLGLVINENMAGFIPYQDFLNSIDKDKIYDTEHFIITLTAKKIKDLLDKYKVEI